MRSLLTPFCLAFALWAASASKLTGSSVPSPEACYPTMISIAESVESQRPQDLVRGEVIRNPVARLSGALQIRSSESSSQVGISDPLEQEVIYFQLFPGRTKNLREHLSPFEVNALLNAVRERVLSDMIAAGFTHTDITMIFKGVSVSLPKDQLESLDLAALEEKANREIFEELKREHPQILKLSERWGWRKPKFIKAGKGKTAFRAAMASRLSEEEVSHFADVRIEAAQRLEKLLQRSTEVAVEAKAWNLPENFFRTGEGGLYFSREFFDLIRRLDSAEALHNKLRLPHTKEAQAFAASLWEFWGLMKLFSPLPQFRQEDIEAYDEARLISRTQAYQDASYIVVADLVGAGGRVFEELHEVFALSSQRLRSQSFELPEERLLSVIDMMDSLATPRAVSWIHERLDEARDVVKREAGDNLIDLWITGDEIHFLLRSPLVEQLRLEISPSIRLSEASTRLSGSREAQRIDDLDQSLLIDIAEKAQKYLSEKLSTGASPLRLAAQVEGRRVGEGRQFQLRILFWQEDGLPAELFHQSFDAEFFNYLEQSFPELDLAQNLDFELVIR